MIEKNKEISSASEALADFVVKERIEKYNMKNIKQIVTIRLSPETLKIYKSLGKGYTGMMADILEYAAKNPNFLELLKKDV